MNLNYTTKKQNIFRELSRAIVSLIIVIKNIPKLFTKYTNTLARPPCNITKNSFSEDVSKLLLNVTVF